MMLEKEGEVHTQFRWETRQGQESRASEHDDVCLLGSKGEACRRHHVTPKGTMTTFQE